MVSWIIMVIENIYKQRTMKNEVDLEDWQTDWEMRDNSVWSMFHICILHNIQYCEKLKKKI